MTVILKASKTIMLPIKVVKKTKQQLQLQHHAHKQLTS